MRLVIDINGSGEVYLKIMKSICGNIYEKSMIDIGCHKAPYTPQLGFKERTYVDIQNRPLDFVEEQKHFIQSDILEFLKTNKKRFDVAIASDVIEHFTNFNARCVLGSMIDCSDKQIIFTPLGSHIVEVNVTDNPDTHKSGWWPQQFEQLGWATIVLPNFHKSMNVGAFFSFHCTNTETEFERVKIELNDNN